MNSSTLKILVPIALLLGGVFALTYLSMNTPREEEQKGAETVSTRKPLNFFSSVRRWVPREVWNAATQAGDTPPGNLQDTEFAGFFEVRDERQYSASYWFSNASKSPVRIQLAQVSCSTCSSGRVAAIPADVKKQLLEMTALSTLPQGLVSGMPLLMAVPGAQLDNNRGTLKWTHHEFKNAEAARFDVPGSVPDDPWGEQWGIVELFFKAKHSSGDKPSQLAARFSTSVGEDGEKFDEMLALEYWSAPPYELHGAYHDAGELTDASAPQTFDVLIYSSTRTSAEIPKFDVTVTIPGLGGDPGSFVTAGTPVLVPEKEHFDLVRTLSAAKKRPVRIRSAWRMEVRVAPTAGEKKLDIGRLERNVNVAFGGDSLPVTVVGTMRGPVHLSGAKAIDFGIFTFSDEPSQTVTVETDTKGVELRIVPEATWPKALKLELTKQPDVGDRGYYKLKATLPAKEQLGDITDGVVVLETKGPNPLRLRIPVVGRGR